MISPSAHGPSLMRLVYSLPSAVTDSPLLLLIWSRAESCMSLLTGFIYASNLHLIRTKYPLAVVEKMLDVFGKDFGGGFDIGCRFETTLDKSPLGPRAC